MCLVRVKSTHQWVLIQLVSTGEVHPRMKKTARIAGRNVVGPNLRQIRLRQSPAVSLEDLAGRVAARGVQLDRSAIGRIENQKRYILDYELQALASALKIKPGDFFG